MSVNDGWSSISLRVHGPTDDLNDLPQALRGQATFNRDKTVLIVEVNADDKVSIQGKFESLEAFLTEQRGNLEALPAGCRTSVFVGWSPKAPQESLVMMPDLIGELARLNASLIFDTYSEDDSSDTD
jgi:hypothetical protein